MSGNPELHESLGHWFGHTASTTQPTDRAEPASEQDWLDDPAMTTIATTDPILIVGGGIIGLSLAWELAQRLHQEGNRKQVVVIESSSPQHSPASWAGAGILPPAPKRNAIDPYEQLKALSHGLHEAWSTRLFSETGVDTGFRKSGGIYLSGSPAEAATLSANQFWWDQHGIQYQSLDCSSLVQLEPALAHYARDRMINAWLLPDEYQVRNPRLIRALRSASHQLGVKFVQETVVKLDVHEASRPTVLTETGNAYRASQIAVCSGAWTRKLLQQLGLASGIMPVRGQIVLYRLLQPILRHIINEGHRYLVPRDDGFILAGSVEEEVGYECQTTESAILLIRGWAESVVPLLAQAHVEKCWAGLRPGSFDGLPYIGAVPGSENVFVAAGHFRSGLQLASGTAVVMANLMMGRSNEIDLSPFRVGRG